MFTDHVYSMLWYHIVWSTKKQMPWISQSLRKQLHSYMASVVKLKGWVPLEIGGTADHVHLLVQGGPKDGIPGIVGGVKSNSSRFMKKKGVVDFMWQRGYGIFTADVVSYDRLKNYIRYQEKHHGNMTCEQEEAMLLKRYETRDQVFKVSKDAL